MLTLVIGGARSGKSAYAQRLCVERGGPVVFVATARVEDDEMRARVARHRAGRPAHWTTVEEPLDVAGAVRRATPAEAAVLIDCATTWLANAAWAERARAADDRQARLLAAVRELAAAARARETIVVTNEVGAGVVPATPVGRFFRDVHGLANQELARAASRVVALVAGLPLAVKGGPAL